MQRRRRHLRGAVLSTAALALTFSGVVPGNAAPAAPTGGTAAPTVAPATGGSQKSGTITLLTGDVVQYTEDAKGTPRVTMQPDIRPDRPSVSFISVPEGDSFYVYPSDAMPLIQSGKLDRGLFDVAYLARNGYGDDARGTLPVIAQYGSGVANTKAALDLHAEALPANSAATPLTSIHGAGFTVTKDQAGTFWQTIAGTPAPATTARTTPQIGATTLRTGLTKVWLDRVVTPTLDQSVPQIGAPEAWKAGYDGKGVRVAVLDTGIDDDHPDFAGRIEVQKNFTTAASTHDAFGHGTHVASIIAGSGAASDGKYRGVAPEATLMIGKVLGDFGSGSMSWSIQGMEWAAAQGADVVNMSLGASPTDGTDLSSIAVNNLTAQYGTLFVIAAGNSGPTPQTINSPGTADAALTVAAVDGDDRIASFSSRGPRLGNYGLKPDIAAPGVGIMAARSEPSIMGGTAGERYLSANGTSMATPHVAGAAAILAQEHPDWNASKLKPVLVSTAKDAGNRTYEQGAGRVDVARATTQQVYATNSLDFGNFTYPQTTTAQRTTTYVNDSDSDVTLNLTATLSSKDGDAPAGMLTLDKSTVTVAAHGTATVTATADPTRAPEATWYEGGVRATAEGIEVGTAVGMNIEPQSFNVTTRIIKPDGVVASPDGTPLIGFGRMTFTRNDGRLDRGRPVFGEFGATESTVRLYGGSHSVTVNASWYDAHGLNTALAIEPEFDVKGDTTVTLDLRKLRKVTATAPASDSYLEGVGVIRLGANRVGGVQGSITGSPAAGDSLWLLPTKKVTIGELDVVSQHLLGARQITMAVRGHGNTALHPRYQAADTTNLPKLSGRRTLEVVSGGTGTPEDLAGVDARGKLVLLDLSDLCSPIVCVTEAADRVAAAAQAGAVAVLGFGTQGQVVIGNAAAPVYAVPTMSIPAGEGAMLLNRLARGKVSVDTDGTALTPHYYSLAFNEFGQIPTDLDYQVTNKDVYRVDNRFYADTDTTAQMSWTGQDDDGLLSFALSTTPRAAPGTVTEYVGPVSSHLLWNRSVAIEYRELPLSGVSFSPTFGAVEYFDRAGQRTESWGQQPLVLASSSYPKRVIDSPWISDSCGYCRAGDTLMPVTSKMDQAGHPTASDALDLTLTDTDGVSYPVKERGILVNAIFFVFRLPYDTFDVPAEKGTYQLDAAATTTFPHQVYSTSSDNSYTFTSQRPDAETSEFTSCFGENLLGTVAPCGADQVLRLRYAVDLDLANTAQAGTRQKITVSGYYGFNMPDPTLRNLTLEASFDDGAHWKSITTSRTRDGKYTGTITYPTLARTTGAVTLRAKATDTNGNTIEQTIHRAYGLR